MMIAWGHSEVFSPTRCKKRGVSEKGCPIFRQKPNGLVFPNGLDSIVGCRVVISLVVGLFPTRQGLHKKPYQPSGSRERVEAQTGEKTEPDLKSKMEIPTIFQKYGYLMSVFFFFPQYMIVSKTSKSRFP